MAKQTRKITLAAPYTDAVGRHHRADSTVDVESGEASRLLFEGRARRPAEVKARAPQNKSVTAGQPADQKGA